MTTTFRSLSRPNVDSQVWELACNLAKQLVHPSQNKETSWETTCRFIWQGCDNLKNSARILSIQSYSEWWAIGACRALHPGWCERSVEWSIDKKKPDYFPLFSNTVGRRMDDKHKLQISVTWLIKEISRCDKESGFQSEQVSWFQNKPVSIHISNENPFRHTC